MLLIALYVQTHSKCSHLIKNRTEWIGHWRMSAVHELRPTLLARYTVWDQIIFTTWISNEVVSVSVLVKGGVSVMLCPTCVSAQTFCPNCLVKKDRLMNESTHAQTSTWTGATLHVPRLLNSIVLSVTHVVKGYTIHEQLHLTENSFRPFHTWQ